MGFERASALRAPVFLGSLTRKAGNKYAIARDQNPIPSDFIVKNQIPYSTRKYYIFGFGIRTRIANLATCPLPLDNQSVLYIYCIFHEAVYAGKIRKQ